MSFLQKARQNYLPEIPKILQNLENLETADDRLLQLSDEEAEELIETFPKSFEQPLIQFKAKTGISCRPLKIGTVFSGGQAAGGHNVLAGLFRALKKFHKESSLYGFNGGPKGLITDDYKELTEELIEGYINQGGFDLIGSGRDKIEQPDQFKAVKDVVKQLGLNGIVIIGGDDSNTNAAFLAEYFLQQNVDCRVIGVPKTIDGDLTNEFVEMSFGFDTACKTYSEIIGNIARDSLSAGKYYFFIKLMGRSASHIVLECALQTHANYTLIGEEVKKEERSLEEIVADIADLICERAEKGKNYGVILIPEGIVEFIPEIKNLITELNNLLSSKEIQQKMNDLSSVHVKTELITHRLSEDGEHCFKNLPKNIQAQLLKERDPHGNVQVSKIESERLLIQMVKAELKNRGEDYKGKFSAQPYFCGYEGRSCFPSNFDANYCFSLGLAAALLIARKKTGYMAAIQNLSEPPSQWTPLGIPLVPLMHSETRKGKKKLVVKKSLVDLNGAVFGEFVKYRKLWRFDDDYRYPGPIQFFGPEDICNAATHTVTIYGRQRSAQSRIL